MENSKIKQITTLLKGLHDLNDFNANEGAIDYLEMIFMGFVSSLEFEGMEGRDRANLTFFFMKLRNMVAISKGLTKEDVTVFTKDLCDKKQGYGK